MSSKRISPTSSQAKENPAKKGKLEISDDEFDEEEEFCSEEEVEEEEESGMGGDNIEFEDNDALLEMAHVYQVLDLLKKFQIILRRNKKFRNVWINRRSQNLLRRKYKELRKCLKYRTQLLLHFSDIINGVQSS